jgi:hypothetical protein
MDGNIHEIKAFCRWHIGCSPWGVRLIHSALVVVTAALMACNAPGDLQAGLEGPSVEISSDQHWQELAFVARAQTSAPLLGAEVRVRAACDLPARDDVDADAEGAAGEQGQVRVMLARDALEQDHGRGESVLPLDDGAEVLVPRLAFDACEGDCEDTFVIVFSAEGIPGGVKVEMPIHIEATLSYEGEAPSEDSVTLQFVNAPR